MKDIRMNRGGNSGYDHIEFEKISGDSGKAIGIISMKKPPRNSIGSWLLDHRIPFTLITDNAASCLMRQGKVDLVVVGADRIAANGDVANKIGTYTLAVLAHTHSVPFYVAAPRSTIDPSLSDGHGIQIEERGPKEITHFMGRALAPAGTAAWNPAFDITPYQYITGIVTEVGILRKPFRRAVHKALEALVAMVLNNVSKKQFQNFR